MHEFSAGGRHFGRSNPEEGLMAMPPVENEALCVSPKCWAGWAPRPSTRTSLATVGHGCPGGTPVCRIPPQPTGVLGHRNRLSPEDCGGMPGGSATITIPTFSPDAHAFASAPDQNLTQLVAGTVNKYDKRTGHFDRSRNELRVRDPVLVVTVVLDRCDRNQQQDREIHLVLKATN
jgi:hypothetical protein